MALTLRAVLDELDRLSAQGDIDEIGREEIVDSVARAALLGARGNSGVILSQLIRGAAEELISRPGELVDPVLIGAAMARAADRAYGSVREPAEGTILTVVREMAHRVAREIAHMEQPRLGREADDEVQDALIAAVLESALEAGAGVGQARAGAAPGAARGRRGRRRRLRADDPLRRRRRSAARAPSRPPLEHHAPARITHPQHESSSYRYCTNFVVTGDGLYAAAVGRAPGGAGRLRARGRRPHDAQGPRPHRRAGGRHVAVRRRRARSRGSTSPTCTSRSSSAPSGSPCRAGADVRRAGRRLRRGMRVLFEGLGAVALDGGATLNPSTYELLAGIHERAGRAGRGAAQLAQRRDGRRARGRAVRQDRLRRADALDAGRPGRRRRARPEPHGATRTPPRCDAAIAARAHRRGHRRGARRRRSDTPPRFLRGDAVGFVDEQLVAWGDVAKTLEAVLAELAREAELVTLIEGDGAPLHGDAGRRPRSGRRRARALARRPAQLLVADRGGVAAAPAHHHGPVVVPTAFASAEPARRRRARRRRAAALPAARRGCARRSPVTPPKAATAAERLGLLTVGDLLEHLPRDRQDARTIAALAPEETATVVVEVRSIASRARAPARDEAAGGGRGGRRDRDDEGDVLQPAVAGAQVPAGHAAAAAGQVPGPQPLPRAVPRADRRGRRRGAGRWRPTRPPTASRPRRSSRSRGSGAGRRRRRSSRCPRGCGRSSGCPTAPRRSTPPTSATTRAGRRRLAFEELLLLQIALLRRRARRREGARAEPLDPPGELTRRWLARLAAVRADRRPARRRWRRSTRTSRATGRCSGC